VIAGEFLS